MSVGISDVAVYDGRSCAGAIAELPRRRFEAKDQDGRSIGTFDSRSEALKAVLAHWRKLQQGRP